MTRDGSNRIKKQAHELAKASAIPYTAALAQLQQLDRERTTPTCTATDEPEADDDFYCHMCANAREECYRCVTGESDEDEYGCHDCGGSGQVVPEHCCDCGGSPYCDCCSRCGQPCIGSCKCPVQVQLADGTVRTL